MNNTDTNNKTSFWTKVKNGLKYFYAEFIKFPGYILAHPIKGFDEFKRENRGKWSVALTFIAVIILLQILKFQFLGFLVSDRNINDLSTFAEIAYIVAPIVLFTISNWSVATLFDGKGKMKDIFLMISYCLYPLIFTTILGMILSNVLVAEEMALYHLVNSLGVFMMGYMACFGIIGIHEYGLLKCILTILATAVAAMVVAFILLLCFNLFQTIIGFIYTIYREISLRYL